MASTPFADDMAAWRAPVRERAAPPPAIRADVRRITVMQGETRVSDDENVVLTTVLGSCIAACLYDPGARVGGLNHFLLADPGDHGIDTPSMQRYGVYAMEVLINAILAMGATRGGLRARIFGGASMHPGLQDIGATNAAFARRFLRDEGISLTGEDVGGHRARRVEFRPTLGLARSRIAADRPPFAPIVRRSAAVPGMMAAPIPIRLPAPTIAASTGDVEFF